MRPETDGTARDTPPVLPYATGRGADGWPVALYVMALGWAFFTLRLFVHELEKNAAAAERNALRHQPQFVILTCAALRLGWALLRNEKGNGWVFYIPLLLLAAPIWWLSALFGGP